MKKIILIVMLLIVLAVVSAGIWAYFAFLYTKPLSKAELAELTPDWSVVTHDNWSPWFTEPDGTQTWNPAASFNAWLATVPEDEKAWPVLVDLKYAYPELFNSKNVCKLPTGAGASGWEEVIDVLDAKNNERVFNRLKEALQRSVLGCGLYASNGPIEHEARVRYGLEDGDLDLSLQVENQSLLEVQLSAIRTLSTMIKVFGMYAGYQLDLGDVNEYVELTTVLMDSSRHSDEFPSLINQLFSLAVESLGVENISWALERYPELFDDSNLVQLDQVVARHQSRVLVWEGEAISFHDAIRRLIDDDGALKLAGKRTVAGGGGDFNTPTSLPDAQLDHTAQRTLYEFGILGKMGTLDSSLSNYTTGALPRISSSGSEFKLNSFAQLFLDMIAPSYVEASSRFRIFQQNSIDLRYLIATHRHKLRHGELPESNEAIDEDLLPD